MASTGRRKGLRWFVGGALAVLCVCLTGASVVAGEVPTAASTVAGAPTMDLGGERSLASSSMKMLGALCFCLGVFAVGVRVARRFAGTSAPTRRRRLEIREKMAISSKASLFLVSVDNREYLVASGSDAISVTPTHSVTTPLFAESLNEVYEDSGELHA